MGLSAWRWLKPRLWLAAAGSAAVLAYLVVWQRGFYFDDYWMHASPVSLTVLSFTGSRFVNALFGTAVMDLMPNAEWLMRAIFALLCGVNAALLAGLVRRLSASTLAGVIAAWLVVVPVMSAESALYSSAAVGYLPMTLFGLLALHCWLTGFGRAGRWAWIGGGVLALIAAFNGVEQIIGVLLALPLIALIGEAGSPRTAGARVGLKVAVIYGALGAALAGHYVLYYQNIPNFSTFRGDVSLSAGELIDRFFTLYVQEYRHFAFLYPPTAPIFGDALAVGSHTILQSAAGMLALLATIVMVSATVWTLAGGGTPRMMAWRRCLALLLIGLVWFIGTLTLPSIVLSRAALTWRLTYLPTFGLALMIGAAAAQTAGWIGRRWAVRAALAAAGVVLIVFAASMAGFARMYQARYERDLRQFDAFTRAFPASMVSTTRVFVPYALDERLFEGEPALNGILRGVFQNNPAALGNLGAAYPNGGYRVLIEDGVSVGAARFACTTRAMIETGSMCMTGIEFQFSSSTVMPTEQVMLFTYQEETLFVYAAVRLTVEGETITLQLPDAERARARGVPTLEVLDIAAEAG